MFNVYYAKPGWKNCSEWEKLGTVSSVDNGIQLASSHANQNIFFININKLWCGFKDERTIFKFRPGWTDERRDYIKSLGEPEFELPCYYIEEERG